MTINEVFTNPTVKSVFFEVRFPNLFFLESKLGDFQLKVLDRFPDSSVAFRRQFVIGETAPGAPVPDTTTISDDMAGQKVWTFKSPLNYELALETSRLVISSQHHKTYNLGDGDRFREIIQYVVGAFLSVVQVPTFLRVGLRYSDECPVPSKDNATFRSYYNTTFPLDRFALDTASEMRFHTVTRRGDCFLRLLEQLRQKKDGQWILILDFDAYRERIDAAQYLDVTDNLHDIVSDAFEESIKLPLYDYMRQPRRGEE